MSCPALRGGKCCVSCEDRFRQAGVFMGPRPALARLFQWPAYRVTAKGERNVRCQSHCNRARPGRAHGGSRGGRRACHGRSCLDLLSGKFHLGIGEKFDRAKARTYPAGGVTMMPAGMPMFAYTSDEESVLQIHGTGPWGVNYLNPAEDPRKK